ncbi:MAG: hypothetical protein Q8O89_04275 [Nanoarchaeota archaeon]|nr:hypothetical protein [Nanoarchaeota archaeon]
METFGSTNLKSLIVFEGLDCAGKTSISELVADLLNKHDCSAEYMKASRYEKVSPFTGEPKTTLDYLVERQSAEPYVKMKLQEHIVVMDRSFYSTLAYGAAINNSRDFASAEKWFTKPALVVYLSCDEEVRKKRWQNRGNSGFDFSFKEGNSERIKKEYNFVLKDKPVYGFDTTLYTPEESAGLIFPVVMNSIRNYEKAKSESPKNIFV